MLFLFTQDFEDSYSVPLYQCVHSEYFKKKSPKAFLETIKETSTSFNCGSSDSDEIQEYDPDNIFHIDCNHIDNQNLNYLLKYWDNRYPDPLNTKNVVLPISFASIPVISELFPISQTHHLFSIAKQLEENSLYQITSQVIKLFQSPIPVIPKNLFNKYSVKNHFPFWIELSGYIFDVSTFVDGHPGKKLIFAAALSQLSPHKTGNSTQLFENSHKSNHSIQLLNNYLVGKLETPLSKWSEEFEPKFRRFFLFMDGSKSESG